jgi:hypothetical protein
VNWRNHKQGMVGQAIGACPTRGTVNLRVFDVVKDGFFPCSGGYVLDCHFAHAIKFSAPCLGFLHIARYLS